MQFQLFESTQADGIKALFTDVFTQSEGREEGERIGNLAFELQLTTPANDLFGFVALEGEAIVGSILFTRLTFEQPVEAFILAPVAVATTHQNRGVGQRLIRFGIDYLRERGVELLFTYGDPAYYSKVGFTVITQEIARAPLPLTYPQGWLAQSLVAARIEPIPGESTCVEALNDPVYW